MNPSADGSYQGGSYRFGQMKRKDRRASVPGLVGDIADGNLIVSGKVKDISLGGFRLSEMPEFFNAEKHVYTVVLSGGGRFYRLLAKPCWEERAGGRDRLEMGFKIIDAPWEWVEMTDKEIPTFDYEKNSMVS